MADPEDDALPCEDLEVELYLAVLQRAKRPGGLPNGAAIEAMEEPIARMLGAAFLFQDLSMAIGETGVRTRGLDFLSGAIHREADRLFRLYHGRRPGD